MTIIEAVEKFNMLSSGDRVLVALSGGADSMCLLHFLWCNSERLGITVCAAHFDHCIRGEESKRDAEFARGQCEERKIEFTLGSGDVLKNASEKHLSAEESAREMRYAFLEAAARDLGCNKIATAHNADDNAETVLLNLCRGSGAKGLSGIPPVRGNIIRPLIMTDRSEIEAYLEKNGISHVEDSTNSRDDYTRNVLRHKVMPVLKEINPAFSKAAMRASVSLREDNECLENMAQNFIKEQVRGISLPVEALKKLPGPVAVRVMRALCGKALSMQHCEMIFRLLEGTELAYADVSGMRISRDSGRLYFGVSDDKISDIELPLEGKIFVPQVKMHINTSIVQNCKEVFSSINKFDFNYESLCGRITLTSRRDGDKIRLSHRGCTKSLKELFCEKKLPQSLRNLTPVFRDGAGVAAVYGFGVAERCMAKPGDTVFRVEIIKDDCSGDNYGNN